MQYRQPHIWSEGFLDSCLQTYHLSCNFKNVPYYFILDIFGGITGVDLSVPLALDTSDGPASHPPHQPHLRSLCCCHLSMLPPSFRPVNVNMSLLLSIPPPPLISFISMPFSADDSPYLYLYMTSPTALESGYTSKLYIGHPCLNAKKAFQS